jgi:GGDEF domain-containing protein
VTNRLDSRAAPRARPVPELPLDDVGARAEELARRWAIALILPRPLQGIGDIPLAELVREAPALCAQAIRALQSDVELDRLTGQGAPTGRERSAPALRLGAMAGAFDAASTVDAVEALRGVLWEALLAQFGGPIPDSSAVRGVADLSDRLAYVCARIVSVALAGVVALESSSRPGEGEVVLAASEGVEHRPGSEPSVGAEAVIVDERAEDPTRGAPVRPPTVVTAAASTGSPERRLAWDESPPVAAGAPLAEIEIRDERSEDGAAAPIGSIGRQLERFRRDGLPFAVLLVEPTDMERLRRLPAQLAHVDEELEQALTGALRAFAGGDAVGSLLADPLRTPWAGSLTRQSAGRYWLLSPETDQRSAPALAERLARAASAISHRGAPLEVAVGTAVCPEDGRDAPALAAHADVGLCAARSAARSSRGRSPASVDERA